MARTCTDRSVLDEKIKEVAEKAEKIRALEAKIEKIEELINELIEKGYSYKILPDHTRYIKYSEKMCKHTLLRSNKQTYYSVNTLRGEKLPIVLTI